MSDISMCQNIECPSRGKCYRYLAFPDEYQSYTDFKPKERFGMNMCNEFWNVSGRTSSIRTLKEVNTEIEQSLIRVINYYLNKSLVGIKIDVVRSTSNR